jgi:UDP-2,3-diacylglucosamine hydrolase
MKVIFISDAHLQTRNARGYQTLMEFLDCLRGGNNGKDRGSNGKNDIGGCNGNITGVDDLFILGDFFDFWFAKGAFIYPEFIEIIDSLSNLKDRGIRIHLCEGNHDFFLADYFAVELGVEIITEWASVNLDGRRVLISHGDTVDESNRKYLLLRRFLRSRFIYKLQRILPVTFLWRIARISSKLSKELPEKSAAALAEKMRAFSLRKFKDGFDAVILGHCHKHVLEEPVINGSKKTFSILGDWIGQYSYLCYEDGSFTLAHYKPRKNAIRV